MKSLVPVLVALFLFSCGSGGETIGSDSALRADSVKAFMHKAGNLVSQAMQERIPGAPDSLPDSVSRSGILFMDARNAYLDAVRLMPANYKAWNFLGTTYYFTNQHDKSIPYFRKSIELNKNYPEARFNLGLAYEKMNRNDSAIAVLNAAIQADSTFIPAYEHLSILLMKRDLKADNALALLHTAARKKPSSDVPWTAMSRIYFMMNDTVQAVGALEQASQVMPSNTTRLYNLAGYYHGKNDTAKYNYYLRRLEEEKKKQGMIN